MQPQVFTKAIGCDIASRLFFFFSNPHLLKSKARFGDITCRQQCVVENQLEQLAELVAELVAMFGSYNSGSQPLSSELI